MRIRLAHVVAAASVLGLMAWIFLSRPRASAPDPSGEPGGDPLVLHNRSQGSVVPCAVPLAWRIARVDEGFGLDEERAAAVVEEAAALWERAVGRRLFRRDPDGGLPLRFVYDERQARTAERARREAEFEEEAGRLAERRSALDSLDRRHARLRQRYERRLRDFEQRAAEHNMAVRRWDRSGGAPPALRRELESTGDSLEAERRRLARRERELDALRGRIRTQEERFRQRAEEHDRRGEALERAFPRVRIESGVYREAVSRQGDRVTSIRREIRIYRYDDLEDLVLVVAHELGHALGAGHTDEPGALMSEEYGATGEGPGEGAASDREVRLRPADLELLRRRCPDL